MEWGCSSLIERMLACMHKATDSILSSEGATRHKRGIKLRAKDCSKEKTRQFITWVGNIFHRSLCCMLDLQVLVLFPGSFWKR